MPANSKTKYFIKETIIALVLLIAVFTPFIYHLESRSFHQDENHWIYSAKYFKLFFIDQDFHNPQWQEMWTYDQPSVGRYIIGLSLYINGQEKRFLEINNMSVWTSRHDYYWNVFNGALPMKDILYLARLPMAVLGGLTCFLIYLAGKMIFTRWTGILAALLLAYNPLMRESCQRAMTDSPLIFFMTANLVLIIFFYRFLTENKYYAALGVSFLIGIDVALAAGTKLNGALAGIVFGTFCLLLMGLKFQTLIKNKTSLNLFSRITSNMDIKIVLSSLIISGLAAILLFTALNPYLYNHPVQGYKKMILSRMETVKDQQKRWTALTTVSEKIRFLSNRSLYDKRYTTLKSKLHLPLDLILFVAGLIILFYTDAKYVIEKGELSMKSIVIIWTLVTYWGIMAWIPLDWDRYYLPVVPCVAVLCGFCIERLSLPIYNFLRLHISY